MTALDSPSPVQVATDWRDPIVRLSRLVDEGSLTVVGESGNNEVTVATGLIGGAKVVAYCSDATKMAGALGATGSEQVIRAIELALLERCPVIGLWHSGGAKLADGVESMHGVGRMFAAMTKASGRIPQISVILGPAAGAAAYGPALTDLVIMAGESGRVFVTGPDVVRQVTGEQVDMDLLGGADTHGRRSGVAHVVVESEAEAYRSARAITTLLARPGTIDPQSVSAEQDLRSLLPESPRRAYDVRPLLGRLVDDGEFHELQAKWARNITIGLGRLGGRTIGLIANNPLYKAGCLDSLSAEKAARFVRMCDALGVPMLVVVDVPGYLPGVRQEWDGVVRRGAKLLHAFAEAVVPRVTLITRKAYGGAYIAMNSRSLGATTVLAWPEAEVAVMGAEAAVRVLHRKALAAASATDQPDLLAKLIAEHELAAGGVRRGLALGVVDQVVEPAGTRRHVAEAIAVAPTGRGLHANIPL